MTASLLVEQMMILATKHLNLVKRTRNTLDFVYLTDGNLMGEILSYRGDNADMKLAKSYAQSLSKRHLPKLIREEIRPLNTLVTTTTATTTTTTAAALPSTTTTTTKTKTPTATTPTATTATSTTTIETMVYQTRAIGGIDFKKFEEFGISFFNGKTLDIVSCRDALDGIHYVPSQEEFRIWRLYEFSCVDDKNLSDVSPMNQSESHQIV